MQKYAKIYNMKILIKVFNVFDKSDQNSIYSAVIPKWIKQMKSNEIVSILEMENSRDFCYIDNVICKYPSSFRKQH